MSIADRKAPTEEATGSAKLRLAGGLGVSVLGLMPAFAIVLKVELLVSSAAANTAFGLRWSRKFGQGAKLIPT